MKLIPPALGRVDWVLILVPLLLVGVGLVMVYSLGLAQNRMGLFWSQLTYAGVAVVICVVVAALDYRSFRQGSWLIYGVSLLLLGAVFVVGHRVFGATRWIDLGPFQLQPSEVAKLALILAGARIMSDHLGTVTWRRYLALLLVSVIPVVLVLAQPDLGSALVLIAIAGATLVASRLSVRQIAMTLLIAAVGLAGGWLSLRDYQRERLETYLDRSSDPQGSSYNVRQSIIAVGNGAVLGQGIGRGSQSQLNFLPVAHTDFMFASIAEATGFVGATILVGLYGVLIWRCWRIAELTTDPYAMLVAVGVGSMLLVQVLVNMGMNIGILPVTGIPLPFVSHGGSSLLVLAALVGMLQGIYLRREKFRFTA